MNSQMNSITSIGTKFENKFAKQPVGRTLARIVEENCFDKLQENVAVQIFSNLDDKSLANASAVCPKWKIIISLNENLFKRVWIYYTNVILEWCHED